MRFINKIKTETDILAFKFFGRLLNFKSNAKCWASKLCQR